MTNCERCGEAFEPRKGPGRPRIYCTDACRIAMLRTVYQPAWYQREKRKAIGRNPYL